MPTLLELWWVFPAAIAFSTVAISSGVSGALFFSPFFLLVVGLSPAQAVGAGLFVRSAEESQPGEKHRGLIERKSGGKGTTVIRARDGTVYDYSTCWRPPGVMMAAAGGALTGMISAGLPEISTTQLVVRCKLPPRVAIATSVFTLAITASVGAAIHALSATPIWSVVGWSIPGVLIGSTIGSRVGKYVPSAIMEKALGVVFGAVGALVLVLEFLR